MTRFTPEYTQALHDDIARLQRPEFDVDPSRHLDAPAVKAAFDALEPLRERLITVAMGAPEASTRLDEARARYKQNNTNHMQIIHLAQHLTRQVTAINVARYELEFAYEEYYTAYKRVEGASTLLLLAKSPHQTSRVEGSVRTTAEPRSSTVLGVTKVQTPSGSAKRPKQTRTAQARDASPVAAMSSVTAGPSVARRMTLPSKVKAPQSSAAHGGTNTQGASKPKLVNVRTRSDGMLAI